MKKYDINTRAVSVFAEFDVTVLAIGVDPPAIINDNGIFNRACKREVVGNIIVNEISNSKTLIA